MQTFQENTTNGPRYNTHQGQTHQTNSDAEMEKQQFHLKSEVSQEDSFKTHTKFSQSEIKLEQRPFAPFVVNILEVKADVGFRPGASEKGFGHGAISYNEKHNMIIACTKTKTVQFYKATTLLPLEGMPTRKINNTYVVKMSYCAETETFLFGCSRGAVYIPLDIIDFTPSY